MTKIRKYTLRESFRTKTIDVPFPRYELRYPLRRLNLRQRETSRSPKSFLSYVSSFKGSEDRFRRNIGSPMFTACLTMVLASSKKKKKTNEPNQYAKRGKRKKGSRECESRLKSYRFAYFSRVSPVQLSIVNVFRDYRYHLDIWNNLLASPLLSSLSERKRSVFEAENRNGVCLNEGKGICIVRTPNQARVS